MITMDELFTQSKKRARERDQGVERTKQPATLPISKPAKYKSGTSGMPLYSADQKPATQKQKQGTYTMGQMDRKDPMESLFTQSRKRAREKDRSYGKVNHTPGGIAAVKEAKLQAFREARKGQTATSQNILFDEGALKEQIAQTEQRLKAAKVGMTGAQTQAELMDWQKKLKTATEELDKYTADYNQLGLLKKWQEYQTLRQAPDFGEKSRYAPEGVTPQYQNQWTGTMADTGVNDLLFDYVNGNEAAQRMQDSQDRARGQTHEHWKGADPEVTALFNYIYKTQGKEAAYDFMDLAVGKKFTKRQAAAMGAAQGLGATSALGIITGVAGKLTGAEETAREGYGELLQDSAIAQSQHPLAYGAGNVGGKVAQMVGINKALGAAGSALGLAEAIPMSPVAQGMANGAATFLTSDAIENAGSLANGYMDMGEYVSSAVTSGLQGGAGGAAGAAVGGALGSALRRHNLMTPFMEFARQTATGTAAAGANIGTGYALAEEKPTKEQVVNDLATAFLFSVVQGAISSYQTTRNSKAQMEAQVEQIAQRYHELSGMNYASEAERATAAGEIMRMTQSLRDGLNSQYIPGQQQTVNNVNDALDCIEEVLGQYITGGSMAPVSGTGGGNGLPVQGGKQETASVGEMAKNRLLNEQDLEEYLAVGDRKHVRDLKAGQMRDGGSPILTTLGQIKTFIRSALSGKVKNIIKGYGKVGARMENDLWAKGVDATGYYLELDANRIAHMSDHIMDDGDPRNIPLTEEQAENITVYIDDYDDMLDVTRYKDGGVRITLGKKINGHAVVVELISKGRKSIQPVTAWQNDTEHYLKKYGKREAQAINTSHSRKGEESGYKQLAPDSIITRGGQEVKAQDLQQPEGYSGLWTAPSAIGLPFNGPLQGTSLIYSGPIAPWPELSGLPEEAMDPLMRAALEMAESGAFESDPVTPTEAAPVQPRDTAHSGAAPTELSAQEAPRSAVPEGEPIGLTVRQRLTLDEVRYAGHSIEQVGMALKRMGPEAIRGVINQGLCSAPDMGSSTRAQVLRRKLDAGESITPSELGHLYDALCREPTQWGSASGQAGDLEKGRTESELEGGTLPVEEGELIDGARRIAKSLKNKKKVVGFDRLPVAYQQSFKDGLMKATPEVQAILGKIYADTDYALLNERRSYYSGGKAEDIVCLGKDIPSSTIAHELFHKLDRGFKISGALCMDLTQDIVALNVVSGGNIKEYLIKAYPTIFLKNNLSMEDIVKVKYRGIADILNGISGGKIDYGYGHPEGYWKEIGTLEAEAWAQFGRVQFENDSEAMKLFELLFPNFYKGAIIALKGLM